MLMFCWPLTMGLQTTGLRTWFNTLGMASLSLAEAFGEGEWGKLVVQLQPFEGVGIVGERFHQARTRLSKAEGGPEEPREIVRCRVAVDQPHRVPLRLVALRRELHAHVTGLGLPRP